MILDGFGNFRAVIVRLKRLVLVALLLVSFPTIAEFAQIIGVEIAKSIDNMTGIDQVLRGRRQTGRYVLI